MSDTLDDKRNSTNLSFNNKQARKSSEDAQAGYAQFEKVWAG